MNLFNELMISGSNLEKRKLYRRAAEQYRKAYCLTYSENEEKVSKQAMERCLDKAKIKIPEGY